MKIGAVVAQDFWMHFRDIFAALSEDHDVEVFRQRKSPFQIMSARINRLLLQHDLARFMQAQDVTFFEWCEELFVAATRLPRYSPIVARLHLHEAWDYAPLAKWDKVDHAILVSGAMERRFLEFHPEMNGRTSVVHNGVSLSKFRYVPHAFRGVIGTLGRLDPHKRAYDLIITLHELRQRGYDLVLHIGGAATEQRYRRYEYEVHRLVERLDLEPYVCFQGAVVDTPAWFRGVDIFVSNSCSEGLQVALLEAMASGCYCLSHAWEGVEEALPPENIYLGNLDLQEKIARYIRLTEPERQERSRSMRRIAEERFDIDKQKRIVKSIVEGMARRAG